MLARLSTVVVLLIALTQWAAAADVDGLLGLEQWRYLPPGAQWPEDGSITAYA